VVTPDRRRAVPPNAKLVQVSVALRRCLSRCPSTQPEELLTVEENATVTDLVHAAAGGDEYAWNSLVERYMPLVKSVIRSYGLSGQNAEDVNQTLWLRLVEHLKDIREPRALPGWITTTTRNECVQLIKNIRRTVPVDVSVEPHAMPQVTEELDEGLLHAERHQVLLQALAELPDHQRTLLVLLVADPPLPYAEISRRLGIRIGSIGPTRARALRRLRECHAVAALAETNTEEIR
jgi:RNA polymerase sigma factor (sigma-70 family)